MKRFLRYFLYRELYRWLRSTDKDGGTRKPTPPSVQESIDREAIPPDGSTIDEPGQFLAVLQQMDPYAFEHLVADLWERMGWETEVPSAGADEGVDVIARKSVPYDQTTLIQAKRYGSDTTVGSPEIQQYASLKHQYDGVDKVVMVTTNRYTGQAADLADRLNVKLVDGTDLIELLAAHNAADLLDEHIPYVSAVPDEPTAAEPDQPPTHPPEDGESSAADSSAETVSGPPPQRYTYGVIVGILFWVATLPVSAISETVTGLLVLVAWPLLPLCLYLDSRDLDNDRPLHRWVYVLGAAVPIFGAVSGGVYLLDRSRPDWG